MWEWQSPQRDDTAGFTVLIWARHNSGLEKSSTWLRENIREFQFKQHSTGETFITVRSTTEFSQQLVLLWKIPWLLPEICVVASTTGSLASTNAPGSVIVEEIDSEFLRTYIIVFLAETIETQDEELISLKETVAIT